jgi:membrane protease subunit (stomatin/prohibitin family)
MGIFSSTRKDGETFDGKGEERKGFIDRLKYDGLPEDLVWKFPYENLTIGAQLIVNESQEALFFKGGKALDVFGPGTHTLSTSNIPVLQKLINLPFGGNTPFTAEVWYVNKTVKRNLKWGTKTPMNLRDPQWGVIIPVRAYGEFGIQIQNASAFMNQIVGTQHITDTETILDQFTSLIITKASDTIAKFIVEKKVSVIDLPAKTDEISGLCKERIMEEFEKYGILITNFYTESINYPPDHPQVEQVNQAMANRLQRDIEGFTYAQQRSFDVMETAAGNEGTSGNVMGAGMGLGMGVGIGGAFGNQMGSIGNQINTQQPGPQAPPPPPAPPAGFHVLVNNVQQGPYALQQLRDLIAGNQITFDTLVWQPGMQQWGKAGDQPGLSGFFIPTPPSPPPPLP